MNTFEEELRRLAEVSAKEFVDQINKDINLKNKIQNWYQKDYKLEDIGLENLKITNIYSLQNQQIIIDMIHNKHTVMVCATMGHLLDILK